MGGRMRHIAEGPKTIPVLGETDVLVVGGGPGGLAAAVGAAREGAATMLVDRYGCFGGVITQVGVESIAWYRHEGTIDVEGIAREFEHRARAMGGTQREPQSLSEALNPELFKCVADELVREAGVETLLHCLAVEAIMEVPPSKGWLPRASPGARRSSPGVSSTPPATPI